MLHKKSTLTERTIHGIKSGLRAYRTPFFSTFVVGLLTHMFAFTNKLYNHDEVSSIFGKGATVTSGRWGLELLRVIFPDVSMPWVYGILSLTLIAVSVCLIIRYFKIEKAVTQVMVAGLIVSFPSLISTTSYMFTLSSYAVAILSVVLGMLWFEKGKKYLILALILVVFSLGIYQAYITMIAALMLVKDIQLILEDNQKTKDILLRCLSQLIFLCVALIVYLLLTRLSLLVLHTSFNEYATDKMSLTPVNMFDKVRSLLYAFVNVFLSGKYGIINSTFSLVLHIIAILLGGVCLLANRRKKNVAQTILLIGFVLLLPFTVFGIFLAASDSAVHTVMLYSFAALYILILIVTEFVKHNKLLIKDVILIAFIGIIINNIYAANTIYLAQNLAYENAYSFYTSLVAQIKSTPGFDEDTKIAIIGESDHLQYDFSFLDKDIQGIDFDLVNIYSKNQFITQCIGFDVPFASDEEIALLKESEEVTDMPSYPYYGSVIKIDDYIVVNFGEPIS